MTKFLVLIIDLCPVSVTLTLKLLTLTPYRHLTSYEVSIFNSDSKDNAVVKEKDTTSSILINRPKPICSPIFDLAYYNYIIKENLIIVYFYLYCT